MEEAGEGLEDLTAQPPRPSPGAQAELPVVMRPAAAGWSVPTVQFLRRALPVGAETRPAAVTGVAEEVPRLQRRSAARPVVTVDLQVAVVEAGASA